MSKLNAEEKKLKIRKLSLNRETLRILSGEQLEEVAGGFIPSWGCETFTNVSFCWCPTITC